MCDPFMSFKRLRGAAPRPFQRYDHNCIGGFGPMAKRCRTKTSRRPKVGAAARPATRIRFANRGLLFGARDGEARRTSNQAVHEGEQQMHISVTSRLCGIVVLGIMGSAQA